MSDDERLMRARDFLRIKGIPDDVHLYTRDTDIMTSELLAEFAESELSSVPQKEK